MAGEMAGKVAVVTGAARGLGLGIAKLFVAEGAHVVIADVLEVESRAAAESLGGNARFCRTDVSRREEVQALVDFAVSEFGALHVMVNNAGVSDNAFGRFLDDDFPRFEPVVTVGILGVLLGTQIAGRHMAKNGGGSVINISSIGGVRAGAGFPIYRAVKAGILSLTQSTAIDLGEYGIRVNAVCPGNVPSDMGVFKDSPGADAAKLNRIADAIRDVRLELQPIKREGTADDVANAVLYFAGDRSTYVSGQVLSVDGGATAGDAKNLIAQITEARQRIEAEGVSPPVALIAQSFERLLGRPLATGPDLAAALWQLPAAVVAHGIEDDPLFFYGNRAALRAFEIDRADFVGMPSRLSAEAPLREERQALLDRVSRAGFIDDYAGVRISATGRRFRIENAVVWNLIDTDGERHGQAATFAV